MRYDGSVGHCRAKGAEAPHTGTTIVACCYKDGVVLGSDGRVSVGNYISNRASNKIASLADHVFLLRSGSAPDAQQVSDHGEIGYHRAEEGDQSVIRMVGHLVSHMGVCLHGWSRFLMWDVLA